MCKDNELKKDEAMQRIHDFYYEELDFCGCGIPNEIVILIKKFLNANIESKELIYSKRQKKLSETLNQKNNESTTCSALEQILLNLLNNVDVMEHGYSIFTSWITPKGEKLLEDLNLLSDEEIKCALM